VKGKNSILFFFGFLFTLRVFSQITINLQNSYYRLNLLKEIRGTSLHWVNDGDGLQLSKTTEKFSFNDSLVSSLGYNVLRIPGGYLTRWFDWEKAAGNNYESQKNYYGKPESVKTGLREMKLFAAKHNMRVMYTLTITDSPEKIKNLIQTWNSIEPQNGPPITWFELGNENYDVDSSVAAAQQYVQTVLPIIQTIRLASPQSKIGAIVANPIAPSWNTTIYNQLFDKIDFLVWHRYVPYTDYFSTDSYSATVNAFNNVEIEIQHLQHVMKHRKLPLYLTEYNLSYYTKENIHQNVVLEPRYILLLGNFVTLAYRNNIAGLVKHCLANAGYHTFADINFSGREKGEISISGMVLKELNRWIEKQDSVDVITFDSLFSAWEFSILVGKNQHGADLVIQNHTSNPVSLLVGTNDDTTASSIVYFQHEKTLWIDRQKSFLLTKQLLVRPHSLTFISIKNKYARK